jgi:predicted deacetylase
VTLKDKLLRSHDSTTIEISISEYNDSDFSFEWSCNLGKIKGPGDKATFYAPDIAGMSTIKIKVTDNYNNIQTDSVNILIYKQFIILKADDLIFDKINIVSEHWRSFIDFIKLKKIKASLGLIGTSLQIGNDQYFSYLKDLDSSGYFEIWNHGYSHLINATNITGQIYHEFWNTSYDYQKEDLLKAQALAKEKLGITLRAFGAPGNNLDRNTLKALEEIKDIKVWYFGMEDFSKLSLKRSIEIELPTFFPNLKEFKNSYNYYVKQPYLVLQIHPNTWDETRFSEFKKVIDLLIQNDVTFINPSEYYSLMHPE